MLFLFYLVTACCAVPIEKVPQVLGTKDVPAVDQELLTKLKSSKHNDISKLLIASLADADPDSVRRVKGLVEALIAAGEGERDQYTQTRDAKQVEFNTASAQLDADTTAHTTVAGQLSNARDEVTRLEGLKSDGQTAKDEAQGAYDDAVTELNEAEDNLNDETTRVNTEKATLEEIRRLLNTLLPEEPTSGTGAWSQPSDYPGSGCLKGNNDVLHIPGELDVCRGKCIQDEKCMSIDWYKPYPYATISGKCTNGETCCSLSYSTKAISGAAWSATEECNYYEINRDALQGASTYIGCFVDDRQRDLGQYLGKGYTQETCAQTCTSNYFGLQAFRSTPSLLSQCFCGDAYGTYGQVSDSECGSDKTGRSWRNAVYSRIG